MPCPLLQNCRALFARCCSTHPAHALGTCMLKLFEVAYHSASLLPLQECLEQLHARPAVKPATQQGPMRPRELLQTLQVCCSCLYSVLALA